MLIIPQVSSTRKTHLFEAFINASEEIRKAIAALGNTAPEQSDYPQPGEFERAEEQHISRFQRMIDVMQELRAIAEGIDATGKAH